MRISFKYKFILSFVTIEAIFLALIVLFNFSSLNNVTQSLSQDKVNATAKLFVELIKTPLVMNDLATLDDEVKSFVGIKNIVAVTVLNADNKIISAQHDHIPIYQEILKHNDTNTTTIRIDRKTFLFKKIPVTIHGTRLGSVKMILETTQSLKLINKNRYFTLLLVFLELLISTVVAYIVGFRLTYSLNALFTAAQSIANDDQTLIPKVGKKGDEVYTLSLAMRTMQQRIKKRDNTLTTFVHKLKDASTLLQQERDFYGSLLNHASGIIIVLDKDGKIILCNQETEKLTGYTSEELLGQKVWDIFIEKDSKEVIKDVFDELLKDGLQSSHENILVTKNGSRKPFAWSNSCITDEFGNIEYIISVGLDMTEKNKKEQTIQALLNSPVDAIVLISLDETILEINDVAAKRLHSTPDKLKGTKLYTHTSAELSFVRQQDIQKIKKEKQPITFEFTRDEHTFKKHLYPLFDNDGNVTQIFIFSTDITTLRTAQKQLNQYIQLVDENVMISHTDVHGKAIMESEAFCKFTGYTKEELLGKNHNILKDMATPEDTYKDLWETITSGKVWHGELKNRKKDKTPYWVSTSIYPDFSDDKKIVGYYAIRQDITNKKLLEELSITDQLTSLYNRRYFDTIFDKEVSRAKRDKKVFCLLSLDVDNFKAYNDTYGHQMGDDALAVVAKTLQENMQRPSDFAFRIGGEEFSAIFCVSRKEDVFTFADGIRRSLEEKKIAHKNNTAAPYLTISIGVGFVNYTKVENEPIEQSTLYAYTDKLLYKAKASGRNATVVQEFRR